MSRVYQHNVRPILVGDDISYGYHIPVTLGIPIMHTHPQSAIQHYSTVIYADRRSCWLVYITDAIHGSRVIPRTVLLSNAGSRFMDIKYMPYSI